MNNKLLCHFSLSQWRVPIKC